MLRKDFEAKPLSYVVNFFLAALICISFPVSFFADSIGLLNALAIVRTLFGAAGVIILLREGYKEFFVFSKSAIRNADIVFTALIVVAANFPVFALTSGKAAITADAAGIASFIFFCLSVGFFEEIFFRGFIFSLLLIYFKNKKHGEIKALLLSGVIFGLVHFINLFSGSGFGTVLMQVGYSTLNGFLYAALFYLTKSIIIPILCHALFDIGGLMIETIGTGTIWTPAAITLTAITSVLAVVHISVRFIIFIKNQPPNQMPAVETQITDGIDA